MPCRARPLALLAALASVAALVLLAVLASGGGIWAPSLRRAGPVPAPAPVPALLPAPLLAPATVMQEPPASPCLCSFDVDRTLTGKQGDLQECQQNQELPIGDSAYGGGNLTLSPLGQSIEETFCAACYVAVVTAGDASGYESEERAVLVEKLGARGLLASTSWTGPSLYAEARTNCSGVAIDSPLVVGCADGTKHFAVASIVAWLEASQGVTVAAERAWHFDDRAGNVAPFEGTGFNARMVSCGSRDGPLGLCGASPSEIVDAAGMALCPE